MYCIGSVEVFMVWCTKRKVGILRAKTGGLRERYWIGSLEVFMVWWTKRKESKDWWTDSKVVCR
jgi:hypothetical protein